MILLTTIAALLSTVPAFAAIVSVNSSSGGEQVACAKFRFKYPEQTYYPGSARYAYETQTGTVSATAL